MLVTAGFTLGSRAKTEDAIKRKQAERTESEKSLNMSTSLGLKS